MPTVRTRRQPAGRKRSARGRRDRHHPRHRRGPRGPLCVGRHRRARGPFTPRASGPRTAHQQHARTHVPDGALTTDARGHVAASLRRPPLAAAHRPPLRAAARARPARPSAAALAAARRPENHRRARADAASKMRVPRGHADARAARTKPLHTDRCRDASLRRADAPGKRGLTRLTERPRGRLRRLAPRRRLRHPHAPARRARQHVPERARPHSNLQRQRAPRVQHRRALDARNRSVLHDHARGTARLRQAGVALGRRQSPSARLRTRLATAPRHTRLPPRNACAVRQRRHVPRNAGRRQRHAAVHHRRHAFHATGRGGRTPIRLPVAAVAHGTISRRTPRDERALVRHVPRGRVLAGAIPQRQVGVRGGHHDRRQWKLDGARQRRRPPAASRARRRQRRLKRLPRRRRLEAHE